MVSLVNNHFYGLAELLCIYIIKNGPENSLGLKARNISGDVTYVGSDAGSTISITLELVEFELLCAYTHIAMDSPSKCLQHLCVVSKKARLEHTNLT